VYSEIRLEALKILLKSGKYLRPLEKIVEKTAQDSA
jgi:hypothetical protein